MTVTMAYLCGEYPRATDTFVQREVQGLRDLGIHIETLSVRQPHDREKGFEEQAKERDATHYLLPISPVRVIRDHARVFFRSPGRYFRAIWLALSVRSPGIRALLYQIAYFLEAGVVASRMGDRRLSHLHNHAPDSSGYVAMLAAEMGGFTYSMTLHGFGIFSEPRRWRLTEKLHRCLYAVCVSKYGRGQAMLWSERQHWSKYHVVHCGIDLGPRIHAPHRARGRKLLFVGRLDHVKGLPLLLDAVKVLIGRFESLTLDLVGDGPERQRIQRQIDENGLGKHVRLHGYRSQADLADCFAEADVFVMTSFAEGIPVVLMEAMAAGVPVVAPTVAGIPELVRHNENGLRYPCGDLSQLVDQIAMLLEDEEMRERMAVKGRETVEREFNRPVELQRLASLVHHYLVGESLETGVEATKVATLSHPNVVGCAAQ